MVFQRNFRYFLVMPMFFCFSFLGVFEVKAETTDSAPLLSICDRGVVFLGIACAALVVCVVLLVIRQCYADFRFKKMRDDLDK